MLGLDQDPEAIAFATSSLLPALSRTSDSFGAENPSLVLIRANFTHIDSAARDQHWAPVSGILFDLGVSSHHLDTPSRGFSFRTEGPLDMRMDPDLPHSAATLVNQLPESDLARLLADFGEIPTARPLARKITGARPVTTTTRLAGIAGKWSRQTFQALRIAVNDELGALASALPAARDLLEPGGRLVVISFHSLEDRLVKNLFSDWSSRGLGTILTARPVTPTSEEVKDNPRSKSAKLRAFQKLL